MKKDSMLVMTLAKIIDYSVEDVEYMLPGILHRYAENDTSYFDQLVNVTIASYFDDLGSVAACRQYYNNMYTLVEGLLAHGIDYEMLQKIIMANDVVRAKITRNGDVFIHLHKR